MQTKTNRHAREWGGEETRSCFVKRNWNAERFVDKYFETEDKAGIIVKGQQFKADLLIATVHPFDESNPIARRQKQGTRVSLSCI